MTIKVLVDMNVSPEWVSALTDEGWEAVHSSRVARSFLTPEGKEFCLAEADDFEREVETLRGSQAFQRFLEERSTCTKRIPLEEIEAEIEQELVEQDKTA